MAILSKEQIFSVNDMRTELVPVPEWGGDVFVRSLMAWEKDKFEKEQARRRENGTPLDSLDGVRARFAALVIVDEKGERIFKDADVMQLGRKNGTAIERILKVANQLNGLGDEGEQEVKKNSAVIETNDAGIGSVPE